MMEIDSKYHPMVTRIVRLMEAEARWFETFQHQEVHTSEEAADTRPGYALRQGAKAILVKVKPRGAAAKFCMLVFPADLSFDSKKTKLFFNAKELRFASEEEVATLTNGILSGGVPPFGNLMDLEVYVDEKLLEEERIVFNAGDRRFSLAMRLQDYVELVNPTVCSITTERDSER